MYKNNLNLRMLKAHVTHFYILEEKKKQQKQAFNKSFNRLHFKYS